MVVSTHEELHRIHHAVPAAARTFRALNLPLPDPVDVALLQPDPADPPAARHRPDTLLRITTRVGAYLLLVQALAYDDPAKASTWAYHLAHLYEKYRLPPVLLVVCRDKITAMWAACPQEIGLPHWPGLSVRPLVLGPHNTPFMTDPKQAAKDLPLATLSALTHAGGPQGAASLRALSIALRRTPAEDRHLFTELADLAFAPVPHQESGTAS
ncbi:hypothetical protein [Nocardia huaxiensis]|uniref:Uncharacterized protein n=1 Tax=Nocardia huaxiensis TaxID=2755382 RepID=A0A7D6VHJ1_9NOCA|nr:hypothetical protein [Nocardia huaxiensis]QLY32977.1 hypothetical protein H0264_12710 [Nocardia huaxiensis]UFS93262.1 hypothetical protein LPY97_20650 [Nocardia huaxiensis]